MQIHARTGHKTRLRISHSRKTCVPAVTIHTAPARKIFWSAVRIQSVIPAIPAWKVNFRKRVSTNLSRAGNVPPVTWGHGADNDLFLKAKGENLCATCHEKTLLQEESASVHMPYEDGECMTCHNPHASDNKGVTSEPQKLLCLSCHDDFEEQMRSAPSQHFPVTDGQCSECHSPHQSKLKSLLLAKSPDLCLVCHQDLKTKMAEENSHSPAERNCQRCHQPHSGSLNKLLTLPLQALCGECHEPETESFQQAHVSIAAEVMNCMSCHDPHASKDPKYFKPTMHAPFAARTCDACHIVEKE